MANPFAEELQKRSGGQPASKNPFAAELQKRTQPAPTEQPQGEASVMDQARVVQDLYGAGRTGALETAAQFVTGAIAEPLSGLAGFIGLGTGGPEGGARAVEKTREALTYQPRTQAGQAVSGKLGEKLEPLGQAVQTVSEATGEAGFKVGGPVGGAVGYALPTAIAEVLGMRGTRAAKKAEIDALVSEQGAGVLTPEARQQLIDQNLYTEQELANLATQDAEQLERLARFQRLGIQPTRGDVTQDLEVQKPEAEIMQSAQDEAGRSMRALRQQQSRTLEENITNLVDQTGVPGEVGQSIKDALVSRKQISKNQAKAAYDALSEATDLQDVPLMIGEIEGIPSGSELRSIERTQPSNVSALNELMVEFGLKRDEAIESRLRNEGVPIQPLTLKNFEEFRKALAPIERADQTGNMSRVIGPIRREIDKQVDAMSQTLERSGNPQIANLAKEARHNWQAYKTEFDRNALTEKLIADKPRSSIPQIENSNVYKTIAAPSTSIEQVDRLVESLKKEGAKGERALADLQASMAMDVLDSAFARASQKVDGQELLSGKKMRDRFNRVQDKAKVIFQNNPGGLRKIEDAVQAAYDIAPQNMAIPKGSAGWFMDFMERSGMSQVFARVPAGQAILEAVRSLGVRAGNRKALEKALNANPSLKRSAKIMATDYPSLGAALGIGYLADQESEEDDTNPNQ